MLGHHNDSSHGHQHSHGGPTDGPNDRSGNQHLHSHGPPSSPLDHDEPQSRFRWQVHHPFENVPGRAAIEVAPWSGLLPRWRFVLPADYEGVVTWGIGPPGASEVSLDAVRRPTRHGPVQLTDGPVVDWFGGHNPLSPSLSAYLVIDGDPPHYLAFGQSEDPESPPASLEGIYFAAHEHPQTDSF